MYCIQSTHNKVIDYTYTFFTMVNDNTANYLVDDQLDT